MIDIITLIDISDFGGTCALDSLHTLHLYHDVLCRYYTFINAGFKPSKTFKMHQKSTGTVLYKGENFRGDLFYI